MWFTSAYSRQLSETGQSAQILCAACTPSPSLGKRSSAEGRGTCPWPSIRYPWVKPFRGPKFRPVSNFFASFAFRVARRPHRAGLGDALTQVPTNYGPPDAPRPGAAPSWAPGAPAAPAPAGPPPPWPAQAYRGAPAPPGRGRRRPAGHPRVRPAELEPTAAAAVPAGRAPGRLRSLDRGSWLLIVAVVRSWRADRRPRGSVTALARSRRSSRSSSPPERHWASGGRAGDPGQGRAGGRLDRHHAEPSASAASGGVIGGAGPA